MEDPPPPCVKDYIVNKKCWALYSLDRNSYMYCTGTVRICILHEPAPVLSGWQRWWVVSDVCDVRIV